MTTTESRNRVRQKGPHQKSVRVDIWHNVLWSKYKGGVFSEVYRKASDFDIDVRFFQIAETEIQRVELSPVDLRYHAYPFTLIFKGSYEAVPLFRMSAKLVSTILASDAKIIILAGFHRIEYWAQLMAAKLLGKTVAVFCDSTYLDRRQTKVKSYLKTLFFSKCALVFCYGDRSREYVMMHGVPQEKTVIRVQAAALPIDYTAITAIKRREELYTPGGAARFLYVGRLSPEKNVDDLIKAFVRVRGELDGGAVLRIVGMGPELSNLQELAAQLGVTSEVQFAGAMHGSALCEEYLAATCLVLPSRVEPWGLVVNEALAFGCPVVVSHTCGCSPELVLDGKTGFAFQHGNVAELAVKMVKAVELASSTRQTAESCVGHISQFSPNEAAGQLLMGLQSIIDV
jgi:glycosyltransferase involved in cell wall biosynthesis